MQVALITLAVFVFIGHVFYVIWRVQATRVKVGLRSNGKWCILFSTQGSYLWTVWSVDGVVQEWTDLRKANQVAHDMFRTRSAVEALAPSKYKLSPWSMEWI